jgi:hypothetical protein
VAPARSCTVATLRALFAKTCPKHSTLFAALQPCPAGYSLSEKTYISRSNMSVRVVARIRPLLKNEIDKDIIVTAAPTDDSTTNAQIVRIPNPKNDAELYSFQFNSVYEQDTTQQQLFDNEGMYSVAEV